MNDVKMSYQRPQLSEWGTVADLTQFQGRTKLTDIGQCGSQIGSGQCQGEPQDQ